MEEKVANWPHWSRILFSVAWCQALGNELEYPWVNITRKLNLRNSISMVENTNKIPLATPYTHTHKMVKVKGFHAKRINVKELHTNNDLLYDGVGCYARKFVVYLFILQLEIFFFFLSSRPVCLRKHIYVLIWLQVVLFDCSLQKMYSENLLNEIV